jgi:hypothetical protein
MRDIPKKNSPGFPPMNPRSGSAVHISLSFPNVGFNRTATWTFSSSSASINDSSSLVTSLSRSLVPSEEVLGVRAAIVGPLNFFSGDECIGGREYNDGGVWRPDDVEDRDRVDVAEDTDGVDDIEEILDGNGGGFNVR